MYQISQNLIPERRGGEERTKIELDIKSYTSSDDVIASMICFLDDEEIIADPRTIHISIEKLKGDYPDLLDDFIFSRGDIYPFSRLLERVLFRLQNSGVIQMINPNFDKYRIPQKSKESVKRIILIKFSEEDQEKLEEMSGKFKEYLSG